MKVIEFPQQDPDSDLIEMLEELLESAKSGELKALCCAGLEKDGTMFTQVCTDNYLEMQALWAMALKAT